MLSKLFLVMTLASRSAAFGASNGPSKRTTGDLQHANFWLAFGDSYTTRGFNTFGPVPVPVPVPGNPPYPGRTNVSANWIDFDTTQFNKSLILTYDYAVGGATINGTLVPSSPTTRSLVQQVNDFEGQAGRRPASEPWTSKNAMFSIWIGINDVGNSYTRSGDRKAFNDVLMNAYFEQVHRLAGARNFLFSNVPPIERSPVNLKKSVIIEYNNKLVAKVNAFQAKYSGVKTWVWHSHGAFEPILDNYKSYGFTNITSWGGSGDFWGKNYHPSSKAHTLLAKDIAQVMKGTRWFSYI